MTFTSHVLDLPDELLRGIFEQLNSRERMKCGKVCRTFRRLIDRFFPRHAFPHMEIVLWRSLTPLAQQDKYFAGNIMTSTYTDEPHTDSWTLEVTTCLLESCSKIDVYYASRVLRFFYRKGTVTIVSRSQYTKCTRLLYQVFKEFFKKRGVKCTLNRCYSRRLLNGIRYTAKDKLEVSISSFEESLSLCLLLCVEAEHHLTLTVTSSIWRTDEHLFRCAQKFLENHPTKLERVRLIGSKDPMGRELALIALRTGNYEKIKFRLYCELMARNGIPHEPRWGCLKLRGNKEEWEQNAATKQSPTDYALKFTADISHSSNLYEVLLLAKAPTILIELSHYVTRDDVNLVPTLLKVYVGQWMRNERKINRIKFKICKDFYSDSADSEAFTNPGVKEILSEYTFLSTPFMYDSTSFGFPIERTFRLRRNDTCDVELKMYLGQRGHYANKPESFSFIIEESRIVKGNQIGQKEEIQKVL